MTKIRPWDRIEARTASGEWKPAIALSAVEDTHEYGENGHSRKIHDFPVIWIGFQFADKPQPWPADAVRLR